MVPSFTISTDAFLWTVTWAGMNLYSTIWTVASGGFRAAADVPPQAATPSKITNDHKEPKHACRERPVGPSVPVGSQRQYAPYLPGDGARQKNIQDLPQEQSR